MYNSYEFLVTRATTTTRELHMLRQLFCYFVTLGGLSKKCSTREAEKENLERDLLTNTPLNTNEQRPVVV